MYKIPKKFHEKNFRLTRKKNSYANVIRMAPGICMEFKAQKRQPSPATVRVVTMNLIINLNGRVEFKNKKPQPFKVKELTSYAAGAAIHIEFAVLLALLPSAALRQLSCHLINFSLPIISGRLKLCRSDAMSYGIRYLQTGRTNQPHISPVAWSLFLHFIQLLVTRVGATHFSKSILACNRNCIFD